MFRSILVPLDGSTFGEQALPWALGIARRAMAGLQLLHVHRPMEATYAEMQVLDDTLERQLRTHEGAYLETIVHKVAAAGGVPTSSTMKEGEIAATIRDHAANSRADLIVMTAHARGPMARFWLGSVPDELLRDTAIPLLIVHPHDQALDLKEDKSFSHLLVPLDGSPLAEHILEPATTLAQLMGAELTLLRVVKPVLPMTLPAGANSFGEMAHDMMAKIEELHGQLQREAHDYLAGLQRQLVDRGFKVRTEVVVEEQPGAAIIHHAQSGGIDLICLGTHGRRGLSRFLLGSVADKVIRGSPVPILVQRPR